MKKTVIILMINLCCLSTVLAQTPEDSTPEISLFDSVERMKIFLKDEAIQDYSDRFISGIRLHYSDGHPKKGLAWIYSFSYNKPRIGGDISIYHYMDGEIIEFHHGP